MSTLLQLIQQFSLETGLFAKPAAVAASSDDAVLQALANLNACGYELSRQYEWQWITKQNIITVASTTITGNTTSAGTSITNASSIVGIDTTYQISGPGINQATYVASAPSGTTIPLSQPATSNNTGATYTLSKVKYAMPSDYDRQIDNTHWDKSKHWVMLGPESAQQWEWLISGYISTGPRVRYRIFGNTFQIWPMLNTAEVLGFEYVSNAWALSSAGAAQTSFLADTDTCVFPDRLMVLALKKKMWKIKGFAPVWDDEYEMELSISKANDAGSATLSMAPRLSNVLIDWAQIPDSNYGS
jgi:cell wall-associated NlpC family hydrolase